MRIAIVGTGYVGLVSGTCFAELGHDVTCIDKDAGKIKTLEEGGVPIYEPGLKELIAKNKKSGRLKFSASLEEGVKKAEIAFIAVGTPTGVFEGMADLSYVYAAAEELAYYLEPDAVVAIKSTVPVKTGERVASIIKNTSPKLKFSVASNPEFLREGCAIKDFMEPDRVIIGTDSKSAEEKLKKLYRPISAKKVPILYTDIKTSELIKYASNAFLATKIGFINEMAKICDKVGADIEMVAEGMGMDSRIGKSYLQAGPGFGGSCFPKDTKALLYTSGRLGASAKIIESVIKSNDQHKQYMAEKVLSVIGAPKGKKLAILGLAFKANTDDMRDSSALVIIKELLKAGVKISAYDPKAMEQAKILFRDEKIEWCEDSYSAAKKADAAVIITEWQEFAEINLAKLKKEMKKPVIIDLRNLFRPEEMRKKGFDYISIGRPAA